MEEFFDWESESLANYIPPKGSRCLLDLSNIKVAPGYATLKILNREGKYISVNIQSGRAGIVLQESLFDVHKNYRNVYLITETKKHKRLIRLLPVEGFSDWLLIYSDTLFAEIIKENCMEIELVAV